MGQGSTSQGQPPPLPHAQTSQTWSSEYMSANQWGTLMESGMITSHVQVRVSQLLDLPRRYLPGQLQPLRYRVRALDPDRELGATPELGGAAPPEVERENVLPGPDGLLQLSSSSVVLYLVVEFADGQPIGQCQISRLDPRSPKAHQYGLNDSQGQPACGIELTVIEGQLAAPPQPEPAGQPGALPGQPGAGPRNAGALPGGDMPTPELTMQVSRLLDVPRRSSERGVPLKYVVRVMDPDGELGAVEVEGGPAVSPNARPGGSGAETVGLGPRGVMRLRSHAQLLTVKVDYSDHRLLGSCQIHRQDQRSGSLSAYLLSDANGNPANCGIELQVTEAMAPVAGTAEALGLASGPAPAAAAGADAAGAGAPGAAGGGAGGSCLQVRILAAYSLLNRDTGLFGDVSDPFVKAKVGKVEHVTPTIDNDLNPVWKTNNHFTFAIGTEDSALELEVMNANYVRHDSLGTCSVGLWSMPPGEWLRKRERLQGGQDGELEFEVRFDPPSAAQQGPVLAGPGAQLPPPFGAPGAAAPPFGAPPPAAPPLAAGPGAGGPAGGGPLAPLPGAGGCCGPAGGVAPGFPGLFPPAATGAPPPLLAAGAGLNGGAAANGGLAANGLPPAAAFGLAGAKGPSPFGAPLPPMEPGWSAPLVARGLLPPALPDKGLGQELLGLYPDMFGYEYKGHEPAELWMKAPAPSVADSYFGSDLDLEVKAITAEPWNAPVAPLDDTFMGEDYFPDMDLGLLARKTQSNQHRIQDRQLAAKRKKEGLPELSLNTWVVPPKVPPKAQPALPAPPTAKPLTAPVQTQPKAWQAPKTADERRKLKYGGKLKVERELVKADEARDIEQQCLSSMLIHLDPDLMPEDFEAQIVACLEADEAVGCEKRVWARSPGGSVERLSVGPEDDTWLEPFLGEELLVGISSRRGQRGTKDPLPSQDSFSATRLSAERALYVVCDGHGPFGHLAAFRVAQSLPKLVAEALRSEGSQLPEQALLKAFELAQEDIAAYATAMNLDMSRSGAAVAVALRMGSDVQVAWLGDARAMVATVTPDHAKVDLVTPPHTTEDVKEYQRVRNRGAVLRAVPAGGSMRVFAQGERGPGLLATRALGDLSGAALGIAWQPDIRKMSFATTPGLVLLGSGGLWGAFDAGGGDAVLTQLLREGDMRQHGPQLATPELVAEAQERWRQAADGFCDDATALVLHWPRAPSARSPPRSLPPQPGPPPPTRTLSPEEVRQLRLGGGRPSLTSSEQSQEEGSAEGTSAAAQASQPRVLGSAAEYMAWRAQVRPEDILPATAAPQAAALSAAAVPQAATLHPATAVPHAAALSAPAAPLGAAGVASAAPQAPCTAAPAAAPRGRLKPTTLQPLASEGELREELAAHCATPELAEPDVALLPAGFLAQVVGCLEADDAVDAELSVWLRTHHDPFELARLDFEVAAEQLQEFQGSSPVQLAVQSRRGEQLDGGFRPKQDCFSVTYAPSNRAVYVVCDGHGPLGHLAAFRAAQSLPKFVLEGLGTAEAPGLPAENAIAKAFDAAGTDLAQLAAAWGLDFSGSGATASLALRQGDGVHVAWLGDSRVLVATVVGEDSRVDLMAKAHSPAEPSERQRLQRLGAELQADALLPGPDGAAALRIFARGGGEAPGLSVSRALGDLALAGQGVISHPDLAKTSFASTPGLVLLASGGLCEFQGSGEVLLDTLLRRGRLMRAGPQQALGCLCDLARQLWREEDAGQCDDVTGLLLHWPSTEDDDSSSPSSQPAPPQYAQAATVPASQPAPPQYAQATAARVLQAPPTAAPVSYGPPQQQRSAPAPQPAAAPPAQPQRFLQAAPRSSLPAATSEPLAVAAGLRPAVAAAAPGAAAQAPAGAAGSLGAAAAALAARKASLPTVPE